MRFAVCFGALLGLMLLSSCAGNERVPGGSGFIEATEIVVSSQASGQLVSQTFDEGEAVARGDTIAQIDTVTVMLKLRQAAAARQAAEAKAESASLSIEQASFNLGLAGKEFDRMKALIKSGSVNQQQYDQVQNGYEQAVLARKQTDAALNAARAELSRIDSETALLKKQLTDCFPTSPSSGVITTKFVEVGELVGVGKGLVKVSKLDTVWVKVYLPPADLTKISLGGRALIDPEDGHTQPLEGVVSWISEEAEFTPKNVQTKEARADLVYAVKITIPNPNLVLKIGMPVSVRIP